MSDDELEYFEERAAIREYCGGQDRKEAEQGATDDLEWYRYRNERQ